MITSRSPIYQNLVMAFLTGTSTTLLAGPINILRTNYHGWADALYLSNGQVEVVVVPPIGRMMS
jgi:hypothetical protein